ncbi:hypothetical protein [Brevundimonas sp.]|uniref:hypothetical protein n=1 Tax=Brevundimonas sp. TaxID=1871086 RepID=UPI001DD1E7F0|nr:hypothetical protein [Brevundimonas sp.]MBL0948905.1 hypothetical protein [Brevundimonas sp.]
MKKVLIKIFGLSVFYLVIFFVYQPGENLFEKIAFPFLYTMLAYGVFALICKGYNNKFGGAVRTASNRVRSGIDRFPK